MLGGLVDGDSISQTVEGLGFLEVYVLFLINKDKLKINPYLFCIHFSSN